MFVIIIRTQQKNDMEPKNQPIKKPPFLGSSRSFSEVYPPWNWLEYDSFLLGPFYLFSERKC